MTSTARDALDVHQRHNLISLTDAARLAGVKRPVVSMWRSRLAASAHPFPSPIVLERGRELFNGEQVASWLRDTAHGNNPDAVLDLAAHTAVAHLAGLGDPACDAVTALLTLTAIQPVSLTGLSGDDILDLAEECDPDDEMLFGELDRMGDQLLSLSELCVRLVDADYNAAAALERLLAERHRLGRRAQSAAAITTVAMDLLVRLVRELCELSGGDARPLVVDTTQGIGDVVVALADMDPTRFDIALPDTDGASLRLARRRLRSRGATPTAFELGPGGAFSITGPAVHSVQLPSTEQPKMDAAAMLHAIDQTLLQFQDTHSGVVFAPASVLVDTLADRDLQGLRSRLVREGRVRAVVSLPAGLFVTRPRERAALWILGRAPAGIPLSERWVLTADLAHRALTEGVVADLVSDLVASLGTSSEVRAHSFAYGSPVYTSRLLASAHSLVFEMNGGGGHRRPSGDSAAIAARSTELIDALSVASSWKLVPAGLQSGAVPPITVDRALSQGHLRYRAGTRLKPSELTGGGARVLGIPELLAVGSPSRYVDRLEFAAAHPTARLTEPGDIIFATAPRPLAMVDDRGLSVVQYPARILRIGRGNPGGLVAAAVADDIHRSSGVGPWRRWLLRRASADQSAPLDRALHDLAAQRAALCARLVDLDELTALITVAVTDGSARLEPLTTERH
ncbi:MAG: hypothetical protein ACRCSP_07460 [Rhodoglobus sp.]